MMHYRLSGTLLRYFILLLIWFVPAIAAAQSPPSPVMPAPATTDSTWLHLSSKNGDLPSPAGNTQQTALLVLDVDRDGIDDFVIGARKGNDPSIIWFRRVANGWERYVIETDPLRIEAGGAFHDIDGDGDLDIVFGEDNSGNHVWWWENPYPSFDPGVDWTRRTIKSSGCTKHHDMMFGDFDGNGAAEFVFWNQNGCGGLKDGRLLRAPIPADVRNQTNDWPTQVIVTTGAASDEGLAQADIDLDGQVDIIAAGSWFKYTSKGTFERNQIERLPYARVAVADFIPGGRPEIVQVPGDVTGRARFHAWNGTKWVGTELLSTSVNHGHSLGVGDVNGDGYLDIFIGEMRRKVEDKDHNANARTMILLGNGTDKFTIETVVTEFDQHESQLADVDGDGDLDIVGKPYVWDTPRVDVWLNLADGVGGVCRPLEKWQTTVIDSARPWRAVQIDSADLDGDGDRDIITGAWWYRNPGDSGDSWPRLPIDDRLAGKNAPVLNTFNQFAAAADFDKDGDIDLLGTTWGGNVDQPQSGNKLIWARNDGSGAFDIIDTGATPPTSDFLQGVALASFVPGEQEVILSWHKSTPARLDALKVPANPATQSWTLRTLSTTMQAEEINVGDIDGDGDLDILLGTKWLQNLGNGQSWKVQTLFATALLPDRNHLADLNNDGRLDAIVGYETTQSIARPLAWYAGTADSTKAWPQTVIDNPIGPMSLDVGDADGDGDLDIAVGEHNLKSPAQGRIWLYENVGNASSWKTNLVATGHEHHDGAQMADLNGDGLLDLISIGWKQDNVLAYLQEGCGTEPPGPRPTISGFSPSGGVAGTVVTINGTNLGEATSVKFNGRAAASFSVVSATQISAVAPEGVTTGKITVTTPDGTATSAGTFTVAPVPVIATLSPAGVLAGKAVTITGKNLANAVSVTINGAAATIKSNVATKIVAIVPLDATSGPVVVVTPGGEARSKTDLIVRPPKPTITGFEPAAAVAGDTILINGTGLAGATVVTFFDRKVAVPTVLSPTQLAVVVPAGAHTGKVSVKTSGGAAISRQTFTVIVPPTIGSFTPTGGGRDTRVTITGRHFVVDGTTVHFGDVAATRVVVSSTTKLVAYVPAGAGTGRVKIAVTNAAGTATSTADFVLK